MAYLGRSIVLVVFLTVFCIAPVAMVIWGWARWFTRKDPRSWLSLLSSISLALTTLSCFLFLWAVVYARSLQGFLFDDPLLNSIDQWGGLFCFSGMILGLIGMCSRGPLRWFAPPCALFSLFSWIVFGLGA